MLKLFRTVKRDPWVILVALFGLLIIGCGAKGQEGAAGGIEWKGMILTIIPYVGTVLAVVLTWAIMLGVRRWGWSWKQEQVRSWIDTVIGWVEEYAASKLKEEGKKLPSEQKRAMAIDLIRAKFPSLEYIDALLHSRLAASEEMGSTTHTKQQALLRMDLEGFVAKLRAQHGGLSAAAAAATAKADPTPGGMKPGPQPVKD